MKHLLFLTILAATSLSIFTSEEDPLLTQPREEGDVSLFQQYSHSLDAFFSLKETKREQAHDVMALQAAHICLLKRFDDYSSEAHNNTLKIQTPLTESILVLNEKYKIAIEQYNKTRKAHHNQGLRANKLVEKINETRQRTWLSLICCGVCKIYGQDPLDAPYIRTTFTEHDSISRQPSSRSIAGGGLDSLS